MNDIHTEELTGMQELTLLLRDKGTLVNEGVRGAFEAVDRKDFVPDSEKMFAYEDEALPIGSGQTISQPYTVAFMLELLRPEAKQKIMEVGYGSGWQAALLAHIVGKKGRIYAFEIIPSLCSMGETNVRKYPQLSKRVTFFCENGARGVSELPYGSIDRIIVAAEVTEVPQAWRTQLAEGGVIVYPKNDSIFRETKRSGLFTREEYPGFMFVPFVPEGTLQRVIL